MNQLLEKCFAPSFSTDTPRPCSEHDYEEFRETSLSSLNSVILLLDNILKNEITCSADEKKNLFKIIIIIGEQHHKNLWNTKEHVDISKLLALKICKIYRCENISQILIDDEIFSSILMFLRPKLLKDTWKSFPAAVVCYKWILKTTEKPQLKKYVPEVLPTALIIFDDYIEENQTLGLECINVIIKHCQKSRSLKKFNYDEVIFQALEKKTYNVEKNLIISLYSCISNLLENMKYYDNTGNLFGWTKYDVILSKLLDDMELLTDSLTRSAYAISLSKFLIHSNSGKWSSRISRILSEYFESVSDMKTINISLDIMISFLKIYQPKEISFYTLSYSSLLKLFYNLDSQNINDYEKENLKKVVKCIGFLNQLCPNIKKELLLNDRLESILNKIEFIKESER